MLLSIIYEVPVYVYVCPRSRSRSSFGDGGTAIEKKNSALSQDFICCLLCLGSGNSSAIMDLFIFKGNGFLAMLLLGS